MKNSSSSQDFKSTANASVTYKIGNPYSIQTKQSNDTEGSLNIGKDPITFRIDFQRDVESEIRKRIQKHLED